MASTPWGIAAEDAWNRANIMRQQANASESYNMTCIFCKQKVFLVPDDMARMPGHIYSPAGGREYANTGICEYCYDKTANSMDGVPNGFFVKQFPQDSMTAWRYQTRADLTVILEFDET